MNTYLTLDFSDLTYEAQEREVDNVLEFFLQQAKVEGEMFLKRQWYDPQPQTWQEAYCRVYSVNHIFWENYENRDAYLENPWNKEEDIEVPTEQNWADWLSDYLREKAESEINIALKRSEIEVSL